MRITLDQALRTVLDLAKENVLDDSLIDDVDFSGEMRQEQKRQEQACLMVDEFLQVINDDKTAELAGELMIAECQLKKKSNGRVDLKNGDKTPIGMTRTMFAIMSQFAKGMPNE
jgi:hypothetical protein